MSNIDKQKRKWLALGGVTLGATLFSNPLLAAVSTPRPKMLNFYNVNTRERLSSHLKNGHVTTTHDLLKLNHFLRDRRTQQVTDMDLMLFNKFYRLQTTMGLRNCEIEIICGYRSPKTNAMMHNRSRAVAKKSYHIRGQAIDFRIKNIALHKVRSGVMNLKSGGVGYYPRSNFVHVDTGPVRSWRGS